MEKIMTIQQVMPVNEREYTDRSGQLQKFVSRGLLLSDGVDRMYAELTGEGARRTDLAAGQTCTVQMACNARRWEDKNHDERYSNDITIIRIGV